MLRYANLNEHYVHVEMMGLIGAGNNPMVGMTVSTAVSVAEALNKYKCKLLTKDIQEGIFFI